MTPQNARDWINLVDSLNISKAVLFILLLTLAVMLLLEKSGKKKPLTAIAKNIGKAINGEVITRLNRLDERINGIESSLDDLDTRIIEQENEASARNARQARVRLLRFNGELVAHKLHTHEEFRNVIRDVDEYETYCALHPEFKNNEAKLSIENIKTQYRKCLEEGDFLPEIST